jgi:hypothetical protein
LKLFQEWGEGGKKESDGGGEFKYDIFYILKELLQMPQHTPSTTIKKKCSYEKKFTNQSILR